MQDLDWKESRQGFGAVFRNEGNFVGQTKCLLPLRRQFCKVCPKPFPLLLAISVRNEILWVNSVVAASAKRNGNLHSIKTCDILVHTGAVRARHDVCVLSSNASSVLSAHALFGRSRDLQLSVTWSIIVPVTVPDLLGTLSAIQSAFCACSRHHCFYLSGTLRDMQSAFRDCSCHCCFYLSGTLRDEQSAFRDCNHDCKHCQTTHHISQDFLHVRVHVSLPVCVCSYACDVFVWDMVQGVRDLPVMTVCCNRVESMLLL